MHCALLVNPAKMQLEQYHTLYIVVQRSFDSRSVIYTHASALIANMFSDGSWLLRGLMNVLLVPVVSLAVSHVSGNQQCGVHMTSASCFLSELVRVNDHSSHL